MSQAYKTLVAKAVEINCNMNRLQEILARKRSSKEAKDAQSFWSAIAYTPCNTMEEAAAALVEKYGYDGALHIADSHGEESTGQDLVRYSALSEFISQMYEVSKKSEGKIRLSLQASDDLAIEPEVDLRTAQGTQESFSLNITLNEKQLTARDFAFQGKSFCLIGPAGSGKTTAQRAVSEALYDSGKLLTTTFHIGGADVTAPSIAFCAFTRRAAGNLRKAIHKEPKLAEVFKHNIMTIHALLEYAPEYYWDSIEGKEKFRFAPRRNAANPLTITHLVIEEASQVGAYDLYAKLYDALPSGAQIIFIGDLNQLPPAFGPSILNYALTQLPIVELTEVYRNQGIVLENAHNILNGRSLVEDKDFRVVRGKRDIQLGQERMSTVVYNMLRTMTESIGDDGLPEYDVENDIILSPFNVQPMGTENMNKWIAQFEGEKRDAVVHEIIAGRQKLYLAIGDKVMVNKRDGVIKDIFPNPAYYGKQPQLAGKDLSRFGHRMLGKDAGLDFEDMAGDLNYENFSLEALAEEKMERKQQASHCVIVDYGDDYEEEVSAVGDFSEACFSLGYCLTVYKAQGSEWRKVIFLMHKDHAVGLFRESFYTAVTRARTKVDIIGKDYLIERTIKSQRIKGNTLKDKLAFFNSGINNTVDVQVIK
jgi:energy-coupling factor transporter ATP-binding protein EcfA2